MRTIRMSPDESTLYETFQEGHPVQVRVTVTAGEEKEYEKGRTVKVVHERGEAEGRIVSEPIEVNARASESSKKTLSLVVEKP